MFISLRLSERRALLFVNDLVLVNLTVLFSLWIWTVRGGFPFDRAFLIDKIEWFVILSALWLFSSLLVGLYDLRRITDLGAASNSLARAIGLVLLVYIGIYFFFPDPGSLPRGIVLYQGISGFVLIILSRFVFASLLRRTAFARRAIVVGGGISGMEIVRAILQYAPVHYQIVGFVDDDISKQGKRISVPLESKPAIELPVLGTRRDLIECVQANGVREIILAVTNDVSTEMIDTLLECKVQGREITLMPVLYEQLTGMVPVDHIGNNWNAVLPLEAAESGGWYPIGKRIFDITGALIGLICFLPLLPLLVLAIKLDSPGSPFYSQTRVGKGGRLFTTYKLRTMVENAEKSGAQQAELNDPRVTRVGKWLRKMRLDEMPQLLNVLKGDMSAVGPRPERPEHLKDFDRLIPFHRLRNSVRPGMAGWAVINFEYIDSIADAKIRLQYDLYYIKHQSLWLDSLILIRTIGQVFALKGR